MSESLIIDEYRYLKSNLKKTKESLEVIISESLKNKDFVLAINAIDFKNQFNNLFSELEKLEVFCKEFKTLKEKDDEHGSNGY